MKKIQSSNINSKLPTDILHQLIFSKLSIFDLLACRQVCKQWKKILLHLEYSNLFFAEIVPPRRSNLHCIDFDPKHLGGMNSVASITFHPNISDDCHIDIINSCRGLLCFTFYSSTSTRMIRFGILNPITNEFIQLSSNYSSTTKYYALGFGFSPKTKQYKIVRHSMHTFSSSLVEIFSIDGTTDETQRRHCQGKWTRLGNIPLDIDKHGAYFNGGLYWVGAHLQQPHYNNLIYRLDLDDYKLDQFCIPQLVGLWQDGICRSFFFGVVNGDFYLTFQDHNFDYQVWRMESQDYSLWTKVFVFPRLNLMIPNQKHPRISSLHLQLIKFCQDGKILCLRKGLDLLLYDPITNTTQTLTDEDVEIKKYLEVYSIDFNFNPLCNILAGDVAA